MEKIYNLNLTRDELDNIGLGLTLKIKELRELIALPAHQGHIGEETRLLYQLEIKQIESLIQKLDVVMGNSK